MIYLIICLILIILCIPFVYLTIKFSNPYRCIMIVGVPGAGKSTLMVKLAQQYRARGWNVYADTYIPGTYKIDPSDLGQFAQDEKSIILLDEIGTTWDNRAFKQFQTYSRDYFKLHRHHKHRIFMFSQSFDVDKKIRDVTDKIYLLINFFGWFSVAKEIKMRWVAVQPGENSEGRLAKAMIVTPFLLAPFGARMYIFIPRWVKLFNSFELDPLPAKTYAYTPYPPGVSIDKKGRVHIKHQKKYKSIIDKVMELKNYEEENSEDTSEEP